MTCYKIIKKPKMIESSLSSAHSLLLNEAVYKTLASDKKRPLYLHEWLSYLDKNLQQTPKSDIKPIQQKLLNQLMSLFNAFPGPPLRYLIAKNISTLFSIGEIIDLYQTLDKCLDLLKSKEHETQLQQMAKLCALNVIGALYEKLGRMVGSSYEETVQVLLKYMKSADSLVRIEIVQTFEKILFGLGTAGQSIHKDIYKNIKKQMMQDRVQAVRCACIKCLCEMIKHSTFLYLPTNYSSTNFAAMSSNVSSELETNIQLGFKMLDGSNYDIRCNVATYLAQLIYYSLSHLQKQQLQLQQQQQAAAAAAANTISNSNNDSPSNEASSSSSNSKQQRQQAAQQQQQNQLAQMIMLDKIKNTLNLLSNGFNKSNSSSMSFNLVKGAASSLVANNSNDSPNSNQIESVSSINRNNNINQSNLNNSTNSSPNTINSSSSSSSSSSSQINREIRIGVTYAYVELANLMGGQWLERNLKLFLTHILNLVNNTKSVQNHLDAVYSRKCVQFILRSIIGGMLNEKVQIQAARELINIIDKCINGIDLIVNNDSNELSSTMKQSNNNNSVNQQHVLICAIYELSCILKSLNTSTSILVSDDSSLKMIDKILATLMYPNPAVKCVSAWCLRTLACSLPALLTPLLDNCMDKLSLIRNPSDALDGYGYACAALLGAVSSCPLGIPNLKSKIAFNIGEELLRTASQSNNITLALQKTSIGWLLLGSFMTLGSTVVRKHIPRLKKLWNLTMPSSLEQLESEKKRGDLFTWQLSLESRAGALASIHSFLVNCNDLITQNDTNLFLSNSSTSTPTINDLLSSNESQTPSSNDLNLINSILTPIEGAILLLSQLANIIKLNNNSVKLKVQAATFRLRLYQTLLALPAPKLYESNFAIILRELVAEFTLADQPSSTLVTSTLRSVCHSNDSILFAKCWLQDTDFKAIEDQLQPHSASGCEALEHDITYLYQRTTTKSSFASLSNSAVSILNVSTIKSLSNTSFYGSLSSMYATNSNQTNCLAALPLGVAVIDASIKLFGIMYPKIPNKHRLQIILHFIDYIQKQPTSKSNAASKQALQINIFTAVLGSLKSLAENKSDIGDDSIRQATLKLVMETLCHSNLILRCAAGEALGRMTQVVSDSKFVTELAQFCFEKLRNSHDETSRTGYALGLGCLHRYVGNMGAGQHMTSSVSILFAMAQNSSSSIVQVWAIHALYLIIDSGGSMFRNYIEPCVEFIAQSVLSIPYTNRDVFVGLGKLLSSIITFMGPELQMNTASISDMRVACLTTCTVMQMHFDSMIRAEAIQSLQELHLFAPTYVNLKTLVPYLLNSLVSKDFLLRKVSVSCMRQLCQKDSIEVCSISKSFVQETKPIGLLSLINDRGLEGLLFKMLDIETNADLIRDLHDILNSLLCSLLNESTLKHWIYLCKDIAVSADEASSVSAQDDSSTNQAKNNKKKTSKKAQNEDEDDEEEDDDDSQTLQISSNQNDPSKKLGDQINSNLKLKQITKLISPKWPNRVFAIELIRRIISMCASSYSSTISTKSSTPTDSDNNKFIPSSKSFSNINDLNVLKQMAHFDLSLAKKLKTQYQNSDENYLILFLQDLMRVACMGSTSSCDPLKLAGLDLLHDLILFFAQVEEPNPEFKGHLILEQYQAQVSAALRPQFSIETSAHVTAKACQVCSMWISSGVARDLNDLRRVHQLLVSSLQKLTDSKQAVITPITTNTDHLIYSELSLTVEKLAVLRAWAEVYIVAHKKTKSKISSNGSESLLSLVQPELSILSYHWSVALKDYAFLCLPSEYSSQLPIEGGAFYHADLVESSKPIYKEHFTKILLAYSIWLNEIKFQIQELPANNGKNIENEETRQEKLFFMLLGLSLETLSNTTGLAQLSDETIENILESIDYLLRTSLAKTILLSKSVHLMVEILSILYKVKLTRDLMSINLLVIRIVEQINQLRLKEIENDKSCNESNETNKNEKNSSSLIFVILEILIRDLIKYIPHLLNSTNHSNLKEDKDKYNSSANKSINKSSFLYLHVNTCKMLTLKDVELISLVINVLNDLPFHLDMKLESKYIINIIHISSKINYKF